MKSTIEVWGKQTEDFLVDFFGDESYKGHDSWEMDYNSKDLIDIKDFIDTAILYDVQYRIYKDNETDNLIASSE